MVGLLAQRRLGPQNSKNNIDPTSCPARIRGSEKVKPRPCHDLTEWASNMKKPINGLAEHLYKKSLVPARGQTLQGTPSTAFYLHFLDSALDHCYLGQPG